MKLPFISFPKRLRFAAPPMLHIQSRIWFEHGGAGQLKCALPSMIRANLFEEPSYALTKVGRLESTWQCSARLGNSIRIHDANYVVVSPEETILRDHLGAGTAFAWERTSRSWARLHTFENQPGQNRNKQNNENE